MWSVKGGSGVTVTAALTATMCARRSGRALIVDLRGDQPAALGLAEPGGPGVRDWLASTDGSASALGRLLVEVGGGLWVLPAGAATAWSADRPAQLVALLGKMDCEIVIDAGVIDGPGLSDHPVVSLGRTLAAAGRSLLVTRPCYLGLRRAMSTRVIADGVVLVTDPARTLGAPEVSMTLHLPVVATVMIDPTIARSVDSGMLVRRSHRAVERALRSVA